MLDNKDSALFSGKILKSLQGAASPVDNEDFEVAPPAWSLRQADLPEIEVAAMMLRAIEGSSGSPVQMTASKGGIHERLLWPILKVHQEKAAGSLTETEMRKVFIRISWKIARSPYGRRDLSYAYARWACAADLASVEAAWEWASSDAALGNIAISYAPWWADAFEMAEDYFPDEHTFGWEDFEEEHRKASECYSEEEAGEQADHWISRSSTLWSILDPDWDAFKARTALACVEVWLARIAFLESERSKSDVGLLAKRYGFRV